MQITIKYRYSRLRYDFIRNESSQTKSNMVWTWIGGDGGVVAGSAQHGRVEFDLNLLTFDEKNLRSRSHDFDVMKDALVYLARTF